jgi:hypothetical protein
MPTEDDLKRLSDQLTEFKGDFRDQKRNFDGQLTNLKDDFRKLKLAFDRIVAIGVLLGGLVLTITGVTVWQLPAKISDAVNDELKKDTIAQYREAAKKAATEAEASKNLAKQSETEADRIFKALQDRTSGGLWVDTSAEPNTDRVVAMIGDKTFARFDGYTMENNYCQPFAVYVTRAYTYQQPVVVVEQAYGQVPAPAAVAADVTWKVTNDGQLIIHKGPKTPGILVKVKPPEIYRGSLSKP